jgi:hypothetical protein
MCLEKMISKLTRKNKAVDVHLANEPIVINKILIFNFRVKVFNLIFFFKCTLNTILSFAQNILQAEHDFDMVQFKEEFLFAIQKWINFIFKKTKMRKDSVKLNDLDISINLNNIVLNQETNSISGRIIAVLNLKKLDLNGNCIFYKSFSCDFNEMLARSLKNKWLSSKSHWNQFVQLNPV